MDEVALTSLLEYLIGNWEDEIVEFKDVGDSYSTSEIGKYFSALSNEANLRNQERAWLVFGVDDKRRAVVGSNYRQDRERLHSLKQQIAQGTEPSVTFREIHELAHAGGRVLLFEIPMAPIGVPIAWQGHYYARAGESLTSLGLDKLDAIRRQTQDTDWTAQVVQQANFGHLDPVALARSKEAFATKYANRFDKSEVESWPTNVFLDRAKLTADGKITRAALILLGKPESVHLLSPHPAQITWKLEGPEKAYEHLGPPFLLTTTRLYRNIRNIQLRILPQDELYPIEVSKYDQNIVLEALHNCIAHQDYTRFERIVVTEYPDRILFENGGNFFEGKPSDYLENNKTPRRYRNPFLVRAMTELNMIDTLGYGIYRMYSGQARRYFPMPDYDLQDPSAVRLTLHGRIIDPAYSRVLIQHSDLSLADVLALDRVQKKLPLDEATVRRLRRAKLIEGHRPNLHVSASVAKLTSTKANYIRTRGQDDEFYKKLVRDFIVKFGSATRSDIQQLLWDKLSDALSDEQKESKISNLITQMRRAGTIFNTGSRKGSRWELAE
ncbi:MAG: putative DNA binding domain-containing protein [Candidatus Hydrogenedentes bacterium]|nr:putative DNA binding domain-containing protein [Candidatus Hydrogenedentota bacterium]